MCDRCRVQVPILQSSDILRTIRELEGVHSNTNASCVIFKLEKWPTIHIFSKTSTHNLPNNKLYSFLVIFSDLHTDLQRDVENPPDDSRLDDTQLDNSRTAIYLTTVRRMDREMRMDQERILANRRQRHVS